ncbi:MAG: polyphosphate kinase 2 [Verrucomicrobiaceae bacterium TMED76]|nr:MAG: polyphosphate kinase 2 [Verrucomicrobiaceae bacterium TMED76]|tara:strand:- start:53 stop:952 length:900 start_codon:yes stop_codon:yes gene_type:complete
MDSPDFGDLYAKIKNATPVIKGQEVTPEIIKKYFNDQIYPYQDRMDMEEYYKQKLGLQIELVKLHNWIHESGQKVLIIFEGRDAAGKGSTIKRFMEHLNPRWANIVALEKPTEDERGQWYFQRYVKHLPSRGQIIFFDRSWYNRAGVERVMDFCSNDDYEHFLENVPLFERMLTQSGTFLIKFYLSVSRDEQARRFKQRETNPLKKWKLSPIDKEAQQKWDDYTEAKNEMFVRTNSAHCPWIVIKSEDKRRGRIETMKAVLNSFEYPDKNESFVGKTDPLIVAKVNELIDSEGKSKIDG